MTSEPSVLNVHTPISSLAIILSSMSDGASGDPSLVVDESHKATDDNLLLLFDQISKKTHFEFQGRRVKSGWIKYSWNGSIWNLDDESDFSIFVWRRKSITSSEDAPTLHVRNPDEPLPPPEEYRNPSFYLFKPAPSSTPSTSRSHSRAGRNSTRSRKTKKPKDDVPAFKKAFERFHNENGVRTVMGSIGPVNDVRMLLRNGYRHVYMSRRFALKHGFIPRDASPGHYGYEGLVNIGSWPVTVGRTRTMHPIYLSEESHFDVVLGRSFWEKRQIKLDPADPTDVVCMDTGEKIDCELVILKDGKGQIVTVT